MFKDLADKRRAFRSLKQADITPELIEKAAQVAQLAPSCMNNQPWKFVFVYDK
jgi:nitroreductase